MRKTKFVGPIIVFLIWLILSEIKIVNPLFLPSPIAVFVRFFKLIFSKKIYWDIFCTLYRVVMGFAISVIIGIPFGLILGFSKKIRESMEFLVDFFRSIPALTFFPLFMIAFGLGNSSQIAVSVFACTPVILINTIYGVLNAKETRLMAAKTMRTKKMEIFSKVIFWDALPSISTGIRVSLSMSLLVIIITEMFVGTEFGLGQRIYNDHLVYRITDMYSTIGLIGLIGYMLNRLYLLFESKYIHWAGK